MVDGTLAGNSHINMGPGSSKDDFARVDLEDTPQEGSVSIDDLDEGYLPRLSLYDGDEPDHAAFELLLPTTEAQAVWFLRDRTSYLLENLPESVREQLDAAEWEME